MYYLPSGPFHWSNSYHLMAQFNHFIQLEFAYIRFVKCEHLVVPDKRFVTLWVWKSWETHRLNRNVGS